MPIFSFSCNPVVRIPIVSILLFPSVVIVRRRKRREKMDWWDGSGRESWESRVDRIMSVIKRSPITSNRSGSFGVVVGKDVGLVD